MENQAMQPFDCKRERGYCTRIGFALTIDLVWTLLWSLALIWMAIQWPALGIEENILLWSSAGAYLGGVVLAWWIVRKVPRVPLPKRRIARASVLRWVIGGVTLMQVGAAIGILANELIYSNAGMPSVDLLSQAVEQMPPAVMLLITCVAAPLYEEFIFRYLCAGRLARYGELPAALVSSLMFSLFHANMMQFFYAFGMGMLLSYAYFRTGKFMVPCLLHVLFNLYGAALPLAIGQNEVLLMAYMVLSNVLSLWGAVILSRHLRRLRWRVGTKQAYLSVLLLNPGMLFATVLCIAEYGFALWQTM